MSKEESSHEYEAADDALSQMHELLAEWGGDLTKAPPGWGFGGRSTGLQEAGD